MLMGIDIGTSGIKAALVHPEKGPLREHLEPHDIITPQPGWAEQNPDTWMEKVGRCVRSILKDGDSVRAVAFSGQMHSFVFLDADGLPLQNAVIWADARSDHEITDAMTLVGKDFFHSRTLNRLAAGFGLASLLWLKKHAPATFDRIRHVLCPKDYIRSRLCGDIAQELSDGSATCCMDAAAGEWAWDILDTLGIPGGIFPRLASSVELAGRVTAEGAALSGLPEGTPLYFGGMDQGAASIGVGIIRPGVFGSNIGTGGQVSTCLRSPLHDAQYRATTILHAIPGHWTMYGANLAAGLSLKWLRSALFPSLSFAEMDAVAAKAAPGCDGLLFLPHLAGERTPFFDPNARGIFHGLALRHGAPEIIRSVMEGVGFALRECFAIMVEAGAAPEKVIAMGGGAKSPLWLQIQADMYGMPVEASGGGDACVGDAILAGVGSGVFRSISEGVESLSRGGGDVYEPSPAVCEVYAERNRGFDEVYYANRALFH